jgi:hypothetical protein
VLLRPVETVLFVPDAGLAFTKGDIMSFDNEKFNKELDNASRKLQTLTPALRYLMAAGVGAAVGFVLKWAVF